MQAVKSADGREMVEALLLEWERKIEVQHEAFFRPNLTAVRRSLGL